MGASVRPEGGERIARNIKAMRDQGANEHDIEAYLRDVEGLKPEETHPQFNADPLIPYAPHSKPAPKSYGGGEETAGTLQDALDYVPFATKGMAGLDALGSAIKTATVGRSLSDVAEGKPGDFLGTLKAAYNQNYDARQEALKDFREEHPTQHKVAATVGIVAPALATLGGSAAAEGAANAGRIAGLVKGAAAGAGYGALQGVSDAHGSLEDYKQKILQDAGLGAVGGGIVAPIVGKAASMVAKPVGAAVSKGASALADRLPEGRTASFLDLIARSTGKAGRASARLGAAAEADQAAGFVPNDVPQGFQGIALDRAGPAVEGVAEGIASRPGPGRSVLHKTLNDRQAGMRQGVTEALEKGTGVKKTSGLAVVEREMDKLKREGDKAFAKAREATKGKAIKSESLDAVKATDTGAAAYEWALARKGDRLEALPQIQHPPEIPVDLRGGITPERWQEMLARMETRGMDVPKGPVETLPDPEVIHLMKRYLRRIADNPNGDSKARAEAAGAGKLLDKVRNELPAEWREADRIYAKHARLRDMAERGRNAMSTKVSPKASTPAKASAKSLGRLERDLAKASPEEQAVAREAAAGSAFDLMESGGKNIKSPGRIFSKSDERVRQMRQAFPSDESAQQFQDLVGAYDRSQEQLTRVLKGSPTGFRNALEAQARDEMAPGAFMQLVTGHPLNAGKALLRGGANAASAKARQQEDAIIAQWLTSPDAEQIPAALKSMIFRRLLEQRSRKALTSASARATAAQNDR